MSLSPEGAEDAAIRRMPPWMQIALLVFLGVLAIACRITNIDQVFSQDRVTFLDSDCYTRMERVRQLEESGGLPVRYHQFENAPYGISSHATSPLDYAILITSLPLRLAYPIETARDLAGAWISPLVGVAGFLALAFLLRGMPGRWRALAAYAILPALTWAQNVGRPDHQSLLTVLLAVALALEWRFLLGQGSKRLRILSGVIWGLALWVSFFEPLIFLVAVFLLQLVLREGSWLRRGLEFFGVLAGLVVVRLIVDPWPTLPPQEDAPWLKNWSYLIGELRGSSMEEMIYWTGFWVPAIVVAALFALRERLSRPGAIMTLVLVVGLVALTFWQVRWSAYLALALIVPGMVLFFRRRADTRRAVLVVIFSAPIFLYYVNFYTRWKQPQEGAKEILQAAEIIGLDQQTVLAPWWVSPTLGYYAGAPYVASSSHQSIGGILDVSDFYLTPQWDLAREILMERNVGWVVTAEPERMFSQAMAVSHGLRVPTDEELLWKDVAYRVAMGTRLARGVNPSPDELQLLGVFGPLRIYRFLPRTAGERPD